MTIHNKTNQRRKKMMALLAEGPKSGGTLYRALGMQSSAFLDMVRPMLEDGTVSRTRHGSLGHIYAAGSIAPDLGIVKREAVQHAIPVRQVLVPRHRGSTHEHPEMVRVTLPAAPWEVRA